MTRPVPFPSREARPAHAEPQAEQAASRHPGFRFLAPPSFWLPERIIEDSAWLTHAPFLFWLLAEHRPRSFVELGVFSGFSYFAACQAVQRLGLATRCYAVDSWQGDEHAGFVGPEMLDEFRRHHDRYFAAFSRIVVSSFDAAAAHFPDASIDLLHIDGRHFYEDVRHDFETWKPKLSERAIVLFHDTNVRERNFGVWKFWADTKDDYPHFEFLHGHGLGVLGVGSELTDALSSFFAAAEDPDCVVELRALYQRLGGTVGDKEEIERLRAAHDAKSGELEHVRASLTARLAEINDLALSSAQALAAKGEEAERLENERLRHLHTMDLQERELAMLREREAERLHQLQTIDRQERELAMLRERETERLRAGGILSSSLAKLQALWKELVARPAIKGSGQEPTRPALQPMRSQSLAAARPPGALPGPKRLLRFLRLARERELIRRSGYFDPDWYRSTYADVSALGADPIWHYLRFGAEEGRDPSPMFDTDWYRVQYPDVAATGANPLAHYLRFGAAEGRQPRVSPGHGAHYDPNPLATAYETSLYQAHGWDSGTKIGALAQRPVKSDRCDVKLIAYYLPQFHPIPENDLWWGRGFTEWTNVAKAIPLFGGHYQPKLPGELGFYDLRVPDVMRRQAELARLYGISAFCFHFYWFGGRRLLEMPLLNFLKDQSIDLQFCLCWANENWTRKWDGAEQELLLAQQHSPEDDVAFIRYLKRYFDDPRYLKIDGKPVLSVYRPGILPEARATSERWREAAKAMGLPGLYLVATNSFDFADFEEAGFDALSEFPPHGLRLLDIQNALQFLTESRLGGVYAYADLLAGYASVESNGRKIWPGAMPGWDNTARLIERGHVFHGNTPELFYHWMHSAIARARDNPPGERFVMVNAWNEWAEGAYIEPDRRHGYAYLAACGTAVADHCQPDERVTGLLVETRASFRPSRPYAIALHLFYEEMAEEFAASIAEFGEADIYITVPHDIACEQAEKIVSLFPGAYVQELRNRGRDMLPFLTLFEVLRRNGHRFVCKLHTKSSLHRPDGRRWREEFVAALLAPSIRRELDEAACNPKLGILACKGSLLDLEQEPVRRNSIARMEMMAAKLRVKVSFSDVFVAGTMFWFRPEALAEFARLADPDDFEPELGQVDGTLAHALERMTVIAAKAAGFEVAELEQGGITVPLF